jgi:hypothetical protein
MESQAVVRCNDHRPLPASGSAHDAAEPFFSPDAFAGYAAEAAYDTRLAQHSRGVLRRPTRLVIETPPSRAPMICAVDCASRSRR